MLTVAVHNVNSVTSLFSSRDWASCPFVRPIVSVGFLQLRPVVLVTTQQANGQEKAQWVILSCADQQPYI